MKIVPYHELENADLIIDAVYEGGNKGNTGDDPISKLVPGIGNMGGFRYSGRDEVKNSIVLYTSGEEGDWPDTLDLTKGQFIYYGDNRTPGHEIHETKRKGNLLLKQLFDSLHASIEPRVSIPPIFIFTKYPTISSNRSVQFKGLAVPGYPGVPATNDLIAVWKTSNGQRFQNYRAIFTILDIQKIEKKWLKNLSSNQYGPFEFYHWKETGIYKTLISPVTSNIRKKEEQLPNNENEIKILYSIYDYFKNDPNRFEECAAKLFQLHDQRAIVDEITRRAVDGGRDAIGRYTLGVNEDPVYAEFSLEAKLYQPGLKGEQASSVGVKEVSRLISRIRNRQFGVLVTTSFIGQQAYTEVREDGHPIIFLAGRDIVNIMMDIGYNTPAMVDDWLKQQFPLNQ